MKYTSVLIDKASGSIGQITGSNNRGGGYFKKKTSPKNPNSPAQRVVRGAVRGANGAWAALTEAQRVAWATYARTIQRRNQVGVVVTLTGWNAFVRMFTPFTQAGIATPSDAPSTSGVPTGFTYSVSVVHIANKVTVTITNTGAAAVNLIRYEGKQTKPTINAYSFGYTFEGHAVVPAGGTTDIVFDGEFVVGNILWYRLLVADPLGRVSNRIDDSSVIPAI